MLPSAGPTAQFGPERLLRRKVVSASPPTLTALCPGPASASRYQIQLQCHPRAARFWTTTGLVEDRESTGWRSSCPKKPAVLGPVLGEADCCSSFSFLEARSEEDLFGVDPADYIVAICGNDALRELSSPGKSGIILTHRDRFMIKTVKKCEVKVFLRMLPIYYEHVSKYENSLVTKFFGVHCVKPVGGQKFYTKVNCLLE